ncbi:MAG: chromate efflux transporter [Pseudomonadota bacterium]
MTDISVEETGPAARPAPVSLGQALPTWVRIGCLSFGGPTAQIALMHRVLVDEKRWLSERQYLAALSFCMLLPGPEAMQLATYAGWRMHGVFGGLIAGLMFVLPGALVVLALAAVYAAFGTVPVVEAVFFGVKAAVLVIVVEALMRIAKRALNGWPYLLIAAIAFAAIFVFSLPYPLIVVAAAAYGFASGGSQQPVALQSDAKLPPWWYAVRTGAVWLMIWIVPLTILAALTGTTSVFTALGLFFSKLAVVTFGGAYAVLAYMAQDVVTANGWLTAGEMIDGLGLAETTPGPLILVTEFVGYLAAHRHGGEPAWIMGMLGAGVALWATFVPCFLWIFVGAPYIEWIDAQPRLKRALAAVTAAVVGVVLNLSLWFALHVLFRDVTRIDVWPFHTWAPVVSSLDWRVVILSALSGWLLLVRHWGIPQVLGVSAGLALIIVRFPS